MIVGQVKIFKIKVSKDTILMISKSMQQQIVSQFSMNSMTLNRLTTLLYTQLIFGSTKCLF